jgi:hypothetical protein
MSDSSPGLKKAIADRGWAWPPLTGPRQLGPLGVTTRNAQGYFDHRRRERAWLMQALATHFQSRPFRFCSIGCGYAAEESLLLDRRSELTLIEPDPQENAFVRAHYGARADIRASYFQFCHFDQPFDVVYAASLGSWMNADPFAGMDRDLLQFLDRYLQADGLGVFLLYGGTHSAFILDKSGYISRLLSSVRQAGFRVLLYGKYQPRAALLVVSRQDHDVSAFADHLLPDERYVRDDCLVKSRTPSAAAYVATAVIASWTAARNVARALSDFAASFAALRRARN